MSVGFPGFFLLIALMGYICVKVYQGVQGRIERSVPMTILVAILIYAIIDFPFQIPSLSYLFMAVIACFFWLREKKANQECILVEN